MSYIGDIRKYVGHAPIMATAAMGIIYDEEKKMILLEQRSDNGMWCVPGGCLELGESLEEGLFREVKEETNLDIINPQFFDVKANIHMIYPNQDEVYYTDIVYIITEYSGELKPDKESTRLEWVEVDELPDNILPTQIDYLIKFVEKLKEENFFKSLKNLPR